jgi:hypothetical protein
LNKELTVENCDATDSTNALKELIKTKRVYTLRRGGRFMNIPKNVEYSVLKISFLKNY